jgi:uncharacterized protein (TIGR02001 family)
VTDVRAVTAAMLLGALAGLLPGPARADLRLTLDLATDYVYRGVSQTDHGPGLGATVAYQHDAGWYLGVAAARVDYAPSADRREVEIDYFAGYHRRLSGDLAVDLGFVYYAYDRDRPVDYDWAEAQLTLLLGDHWRALLSFSPDWYGLGEASWVGELGYRRALPLALIADVTAGYTRVDDAFFDGYGYAEAGLARALGPLTARLAFVTTDSGARILEDAADSRWVLDLTWTLTRR